MQLCTVVARIPSAKAGNLCTLRQHPNHCAAARIHIVPDGSRIPLKGALSDMQGFYELLPVLELFSYISPRANGPKT